MSENQMTDHVLVWDLETVPDLSAMARIHGRSKMTAPEVQDALGGEFPKLPVHQIVCIGALIASNSERGWSVDNLGAPHIGERSEHDLISSFVDRIGVLKPQLVTFNGDSFDLPVLRYRAMLHRITAPGLFSRAYFSRFAEDAVDLCDVLASFNGRAKVSLDLLSKSLALSGKPANMSGADVQRYVSAGRVQEVADYCEIDVINTYRVWLLFELFRGRLTDAAWKTSERNLQDFVSQRLSAKPHLKSVMNSSSEPS
jgi:predicted PolB exonuclease-like 3'-5' exonuclease